MLGDGCLSCLPLLLCLLFLLRLRLLQLLLLLLRLEPFRRLLLLRPARMRDRAPPRRPRPAPHG